MWEELINGVMKLCFQLVETCILLTTICANTYTVKEQVHMRQLKPIMFSGIISNDTLIVWRVI